MSDKKLSSLSEGELYKPPPTVLKLTRSDTGSGSDCFYHFVRKCKWR